jgi:hypothetical protein
MSFIGTIKKLFRRVPTPTPVVHKPLEPPSGAILERLIGRPSLRPIESSYSADGAPWVQRRGRKRRMKMRRRTMRRRVNGRGCKKWEAK